MENEKYRGVAKLVHVHQAVVFVVRDLSIAVHVRALHNLVDGSSVALLAQSSAELRKCGQLTKCTKKIKNRSSQ